MNKKKNTATRRHIQTLQTHQYRNISNTTVMLKWSHNAEWVDSKMNLR